MKKKTLLWAAVAALFVLLGILVWMCIDGSNHTDTDLVVDVLPSTSIKIVPNEIGMESSIPTDQADSPTPSHRPATTPSPKAAGTASPVKLSGSHFCTLTIKGKTINILYGVDEKTLKKNPGWLESSALPGQDGMSVIYGHRNRSHFQVLEKVALGDTITVTMPDGTAFTYTITSMTTYDSTADLKLPAADGKTLVLVTCYPFRYSGHAPGKCVVVAIG